MSSSDVLSSDVSESKIKDVQLPLSRIKVIMKSSPGVESVSQESVFLTTKATEMFVQHLVKKTLEKKAESSSNTDIETLDYKDLAELVQTSGYLFFLKEVLPRKITFGEAKARISAARAERQV